MAEQTYHQEFQGYWIEENIQSIPSSSGVYCVYESDFSQTENLVFLKRLIYIGESDNVRNRIANHEKFTLWKRNIASGSILCFSITSASQNDRFRIEAALINRFQPPINTEYKDRFPFDKTIININGEAEFLNDFIVVNRKD